MKSIRFVLYAFAMLLFWGTANVPSLRAQEQRDALREFRQGNYAEAVEICVAELASNPSNMDSYAVMCWSLIRLSKYEEAAKYAEQARSVNRYDPRIAEILAEARYYQGRNEEALKLFQEYVTLAPEGGRIDAVYYFIGEIYIRLGRFRHADIALSTAVRYVPNDAFWWTRLGYTRERAGEIRYAAEAYEKAIALDPQSVDASHGLDRTRKTLSSH
jgi:tetratricopeptide (TPR) repeat protein